MSVMAHANMLTRDDLDALPDNGLRHELIDGTLVMSPAPGLAHQIFTLALYRTLHAAASDTGLLVLTAPFDVALGEHVVEPDILAAPASAFSKRDLPVAPLLVVEVRSASTAWLDQGRKLSLYEQSGVAHYWLADPEQPSMTLLRLVDGRYREVASIEGDDRISVVEPFPVTLNPGLLARG